MIRGGVILVTAAFTVIFLKKRLYIHNYVGCAFVIVGITIVGSAKFIFGKSTDTEEVNRKLFPVHLTVITPLPPAGKQHGNYCDNSPVGLAYHEWSALRVRRKAFRLVLPPPLPSRRNWRTVGTLLLRYYSAYPHVRPLPFSKTYVVTVAIR